MKKVALLIVLATVFVSCHNKNKVTINGQFHGAQNKNIVLEKLSPSNSIIVDSVRANADGKFAFKIDFAGVESPTFYNVRLDGQFVPLLVEGGEKVEINALGNIAVTYDVKGSKGSELLSKYNKKIIEHTLKMDSIETLYRNTPIYEELRQIELGRLLNREYIAMKRSAISFIMINASSLASVVPLYQSAFDNSTLFGEPTDIVYYVAIADSLEKYYPKSPYVTSLRNDIKRVDNIYAMDSIISSSIDNAADFPEISIKDAVGVVKSLTSLKGNTILLSFTSCSDPKLKILNRELMDVYNKYHASGLEIFEVSIDSDKAAWLRSVTENRLPWIQVCDFMGANSPARLAYNVSSLPSYFIINASGEVVRANIKHDQIEAAIAKIIK